MKRFKHSLLLLLLSCQFYLSRGQDSLPLIQWGAENDVTTLIHTVATDGVYYYAVSGSKLMQYGLNNGLISATQLNLPAEHKNPEWHGVFCVADGSKLVFYSINRKQPVKDHRLYVIHVKNDNAVPPQELATAGYEAPYSITLSEDRKNFLVVYEGNFYMYTQQLEQLWHKTFIITWNKYYKSFRESGYRINSEGTVFCYGREVQDRGRTFPVIFAYYPGSDSLKHLDFEETANGQHFPYVECSDTEFVVSTVISDYKTRKSGIFYARVNLRTFTKIVQNTYSVDQTDLAKCEIESYYEDYWFAIKKVFVNDQNELFILGEERSRKNMGAISDPDYLYRYGNIMILKLGTDGKKIWSSVIRRRLESPDGGYLFGTFTPLFFRNKIHVLYYDKGENVVRNNQGNAKPKNVVFRRPNNMNLISAVVNANGEISFTPYPEIETKDRCAFSHGTCIPISPGKYIVRASFESGTPRWETAYQWGTLQVR